MRTFLISLVAVAAVGAGVIGCGGTYECCFDKLYYSCKDQTTLDACASGNIQECTRDSNKDSHCQ
jgi:hypothetical protein